MGAQASKISITFPEALEGSWWSGTEQVQFYWGFFFCCGLSVNTWAGLSEWLMAFHMLYVSGNGRLILLQVPSVWDSVSRPWVRVLCSVG